MPGLHAWEPKDMRGRLAGLERRVNDATGERARLAPDCLRQLESAVGELELARQHLRTGEHELRQMRARVIDWQQRFHALLAIVEDAYLLTDLGGVIIDSNGASARLLHMSQRFLVGRPLHLFLAERRVEFLDALERLRTATGRTDLVIQVRPRERPGFEATVRVGPVCDGCSQPVALQWIIVPAAS